MYKHSYTSRYYCDICGKELDQLVCPIFVDINYHMDSKRYELCDECAKKVQEFIEVNNANISL